MTSRAALRKGRRQHRRQIRRKKHRQVEAGLTLAAEHRLSRQPEPLYEHRETISEVLDLFKDHPTRYEIAYCLLCGVRMIAAIEQRTGFTRETVKHHLKVVKRVLLPYLRIDFPEATAYYATNNTATKEAANIMKITFTERGHVKTGISGINYVPQGRNWGYTRGYLVMTPMAVMVETLPEAIELRRRLRSVSYKSKKATVIRIDKDALKEFAAWKGLDVAAIMDTVQEVA